jgi:hypothetical protein
VFPDPDYPSVNPYKKIFFSQKNGPLSKKVVLKKNLKKLTSDSGSPTPIALWPSFMGTYYQYLFMQ